MKQKTEDRRQKTDFGRRRGGSAIILAVVLTSLLAIVGVIFLLSSRVDSVATSAIADNKDLNLAVDTVIAQISEVLAADVPHTDANGVPVEEYYDYPDPCFNPWLACLEPYGGSVNPQWRQVSDIYGNLYPASQDMQARVLPDYNDNFRLYTAADADGDGVGDSMWVQLLDKTSSKGKPIYAAIRIVDNSGMLNVNTGYKFDPGSSVGSSQMNINYAALSQRGANGTIDTAAANLDNWRRNTEPSSLYETNVVWQYGNPIGAFTPFDISDELKLRNRYILLNYNNPVRTRIGNLWTNTYEIGPQVPRTSISDPNDWFWIVSNNYPGSCPDPCAYDYRHIATIHNLDRIINSNGGKMLNINNPAVTAMDVCDVVIAALKEGGVVPADANILGAQIAANLIDYVDDDNDVTVVPGGGLPHFGFEQPCVYISELAQNFIRPDPNDPNILADYAIELHKPYADDPPPGPNDWRLVIFDSNSGLSVAFPFSWMGYGTGQFFVFDNPTFNFIDVNLADFIANNPSPLNGAIGVDPNVILSWPDVNGATTYDIYFGTDQNAVFNANPNDVNVYMGNVPASVTTFDPPVLLVLNTAYYWRIDTYTASSFIKGLVWRFTVSEVNVFPAAIVFNSGNIIRLERRVYDPGLPDPTYVTVDSVIVPVADINEPNWLEPNVMDPNDPNVKLATHSYQRDIFPHKPIRRLWSFSSVPTVGYFNNYVNLDSRVIQAHPANSAFTNVGEFGQLFYRSTYDYGGVGPWAGILEPDMRINLALPIYQQLFNYLTVFDPVNYGHDTNEARIKGRININTAPWFVLAQLPWVSYHTPNYNLAQAIVDYRNSFGPFKSTGELMRVGIANSDSNDLRRMDYYANNPSIFPLMTPTDGDTDYFERQDIIFARMSNLVTVRSDVFTAYILVRIGTDGPQKRVVAILDRSEYPAKPVKVLAIQQVPDPR